VVCPSRWGLRKRHGQCLRPQDGLGDAALLRGAVYLQGPAWRMFGLSSVRSRSGELSRTRHAVPLGSRHLPGSTCHRFPSVRDAGAVVRAIPFKKLLPLSPLRPARPSRFTCSARPLRAGGPAGGRVDFCRATLRHLPSLSPTATAPRSWKWSSGSSASSPSS
jgi:hypothetical protein